ncbi:MAG TPA: hypothetical protein VN867_01730 [Candidatus Binataceae bacterium]|nr:hypothetical protein [Candidatus Binataceae bacterium]
MTIGKTLTRSLIAGTLVALMMNGTAFAGFPTPEIDPGMAAGGLTILGLGIVLLLERYCRN